jgi:hypothetical protein
MTYSILLTNGTALTTIVDGNSDSITTDLTLIGKNLSGYGNFINENFVKLLENFSNTTQPNYPIKGQLWYDTSVNRLKVYNGTQFVVSGGSIVSGTVPSLIAAGDLWIDNVREQLYFNDGISTILAGPIYTAQQGVTGFNVEDVLDINQVSHTVIYFFIAQTLIGIFAKEAFTFASPPIGMPSSIGVGFTASNLANLSFTVPVSAAHNIISASGAYKTAESFLSTTDNSQSIGTLSIQNQTPLILGPAADTELDVNSALFNIKSNAINQNFQIQLKNNVGLQTALFINSANQYVGIYNNNPTATLDVSGDVIVEGNLTVKGSTSTVSSTTVTIADKNLELGRVLNPTDSLASGGGFTLHGTTDKTFNWTTINYAWESSENINLLGGKTYKINGLDVITGNSLGTGITSAPGLTSVGTLTGLQAANIAIGSNTISYVNPVNPNGDIVIQPKGTGSINVNNSRITGLGNPTNDTDAANKTYVIQQIQTASLSATLTANGLSNAQLASSYLSKIFPNTEHQSGTIVRVFVTDDSSVRQFQLTGSPLTWTFQFNL